MASPNEDVIASVLDTLSPSDVAKSRRLSVSFRAFLARGSSQEFLALFKDVEQAHSPDSKPDHSSSSSEDTSPDPAPRKRRRLHAPAPPSLDRLPEADDETSLTFQRARAFFSTRVSSQDQLSRLLRVLRGVLRAPHQSAEFYQQLWSAQRGRIFEVDHAAQPRIARLFQGRRLIEQESQRYEYAGRLSLLFLTHDLEITKAQEWKLAPGHSRQNAAVLEIAAQLQVDPEDVKKEWRRSRNYVRLMEECGPAFLLELGVGVNWYWEKALNKQDVTLFIEYCKEKNTDLSAHAKQLNPIAGQMIVDGMLAYGWDLEAIFRSSTRLRNALVLHCPEVFSPFSPPPRADALPAMRGHEPPTEVFSTDPHLTPFAHADAVVDPFILPDPLPGDAEWECYHRIMAGVAAGGHEGFLQDALEQGNGMLLSPAGQKMGWEPLVT